MSDLIDRREAIDALEKIDCSDGVGISLLKCDAVDDAVTAIKALPSAQPEIIRCKECKKWNVYGNRGEGWCDEWKEMLMDICFCSSAERREVSE